MTRADDRCLMPERTLWKLFKILTTSASKLTNLCIRKNTTQVIESAGIDSVILCCGAAAFSFFFFLIIYRIYSKGDSKILIQEGWWDHSLFYCHHYRNNGGNSLCCCARGDHGLSAAPNNTEKHHKDASYGLAAFGYHCFVPSPLTNKLLNAVWQAKVSSLDVSLSHCRYRWSSFTGNLLVRITAHCIVCWNLDWLYSNVIFLCDLGFFFMNKSCQMLFFFHPQADTLLL